MRIRENVWTVWREKVADAGATWSMLLLFVPDDGDLAEAQRAMRAAVRAVAKPFDETFGEWDVFDLALPAIADRLTVDGTVSVFAPRDPYVLPWRAAMLAVRVCVRGERESKANRWYRWHPDPEAHRAVVAHAVEWARFDGAADRCSLRVDAGLFDVEPGEQVADRGSHPEVMACRGAAFRGMAAIPFSGRWI
ncbi:hypothetical protein [Solirubrobacter soli]|uniref:hypothetical protein n=1 Tax=Solirubrobacter soli TaxID=363832 RepID=UPI0004136A58|nr:hypothetical protein [Solirubrobacter soli]